MSVHSGDSTDFDQLTEVSAVFICGDCGRERARAHRPEERPTPAAFAEPCCEAEDSTFTLNRFEDEVGETIVETMRCDDSREAGVERSIVPPEEAFENRYYRDITRHSPALVARLLYRLTEGQRVHVNKRAHALTVVNNAEAADDYSPPNTRVVVLEGNGTTYTVLVSPRDFEHGFVLMLRYGGGNTEDINWIWPEDGDIGIIADGPSADELVGPTVDDADLCAYPDHRTPDAIPDDADELGDCPRECSGRVWGFDARAECDTCATACHRDQWDAFDDGGQP